MKKALKFTSVLLTLAMIFAFAPLAANAAESDGVPTVIDVSGSEYYAIKADNYDPDGIIFTGNNPDAMISIFVDSDVTFKNLTACHIDAHGEEKATVNITLAGDNVMTGKYGHVFQLGPSNIIINAE